MTASAGTRSAELDGLLRSNGGFWSLLPTLDLPIFDAGARGAQVDASEATRREALARYDAALQAAFREVADALAVRDSLPERLAAQQAQVQAAQRGLTLSELSYRLGGASQLELLDAQRQLAIARQGLVTLRQTEQANRVLLPDAGWRWSGGAAEETPTPAAVPRRSAPVASGVAAAATPPGVARTPPSAGLLAAAAARRSLCLQSARAGQAPAATSARASNASPGEPVALHQA
ncbi:MAG: TolC family protein [Comamonadaceae bacterium]|nr:TolC family protein [Comamonadaceae bacterium]